ncbi:MAG TPA: hypothetical protein PKD58_10395, partial [Candidatus Sumerlaeota bacterium]|nr:hypothetical protein [Candidatus Sumerlaeota bacterium]
MSALAWSSNNSHGVEISLAANCGTANSFKLWLKMWRFVGTFVKLGNDVGGISVATAQVSEN